MPMVHGKSGGAPMKKCDRYKFSLGKQLYFNSKTFAIGQSITNPRHPRAEQERSDVAETLGSMPRPLWRMKPAGSSASSRHGREAYTALIPSCCILRLMSRHGSQGLRSASRRFALG
ncbi:hypothetical protein MESS2_1210016 [Mesorhizobium metallidurans STM 2683]|uniref:Uncharacterized protein n=1 Tax=Mesorhizobium metallidurans STM 2683 TaxID=1297569 RepID=M5EIC7_9HYPH|nr:hypothetical protein MESS2_1210016 [Mesorhizobium metallidurans STM 2683]